MVIHACRTAFEAQNNYALKALIAGQCLLEYRENLNVSPSCHDGMTGRFLDKKPADRFDAWVERQIPDISRRTAYRWMEAAERVGRVQLGLRAHEDFTTTIEIEGAAPMPLSQALTLPEEALPAEALAFRQGLFDFMADRTLNDALNAVVDGESAAKRITLAAGGKKQKGQGDRKAFEEFTERKLKHLTTFFRAKLHTNQKAKIVTAFHSALRAWPRWVLEGLEDTCRAELKLTDHERAARTEF